MENDNTNKTPTDNKTEQNVEQGNNKENKENKGEGEKTPVVDVVSKEQFDKLASELAKIKKEKLALLGEEERKAQLAKDKEDEIANLRKEVEKNKIINNLVGEYGNDYADKIATAMSEGNNIEVASLMAKFAKEQKESASKAMEEFKLNSTKTPTGAVSKDEAITVDTFKKMTIDEKIALKVGNPTLYETLSKK